MISMLRSDANKLPLDRVPALTRALEADPNLLFLLAIEQEGGETLRRTVESIFGTVVTQNEIARLEAIREASDRADPPLTARARSALRAIFGK